MEKEIMHTYRSYRYLLILMMFSLLGLAGCDIHEYPDVAETVEHEVHLQFNAQTMLDWDVMIHGDWEYDEQTKVETPQGRMRYVFRLYPVFAKGRSLYMHIKEYVFYGDINGPYGDSFTISLIPGEYDLRVWADWEKPGTEKEHFYDVTDFTRITLTGENHQPNTNYRDAFRGTERISIRSDMYERETQTITINLERPFAKYEIITNDLDDFITKQLAIAAAKEKEKAAQTKGEETKGEEDTKGDVPTKTIDLDDYKVIIYYSGFMPNVYNMFTDQDVSSLLNHSYVSKLTKLSDTEASLGFDYIFVRPDNVKEEGGNPKTIIRIGLYNQDNEELSMTNDITIDLKRNHHTVYRGNFITQTSSGGITINPSFDDEYNVVLP